MEYSKRAYMQVPEKLKSSLILCDRILQNDSVFVYCKNNYLYEVESKNIQGSCFLKNETDEQLKEKMETDEDEKQRISAFFHYLDNFNKSVYILVLIHSNLFVVKKEEFLKLIRVYNNVNDFQIIDELSDGNCKVEIEFNGTSSTITTNFSDDEQKSSSIEFNESFPGIEEALLEIRSSTNETTAQQHNLEASIDKLFNSIDQDCKFLPRTLRSECMDEKQPLVRYGDIWSKVHNEKLVIGIPVLNCSYKKKLLLENLNLFLECGVESIEYNWKFYKMRTDCCTFEKFEELFDKEDDSNKEFPGFDQDWNISEKRVLHPEQSAIFVAIVDVQHFLELLEYNYKIFLTYDISHEAPPRTFQLYAGNLFVNPRKIWNEDYMVDFTNQQEIYKNLLTLTSTSFNINLELNYKDAPKIMLANFLTDTLKFQLIRTIHSEDFNQQTFYADENYFKGFLVRTSQECNMMIKIKLYAKLEHQLIKFVQTIYSDYGENCTVTLKCKFDEKLAEEKLAQALRNEVEYTLSEQKSSSFLQEKLQREMMTDLAYQNLNKWL